MTGPLGIGRSPAIMDTVDDLRALMAAKDAIIKRNTQTIRDLTAQLNPMVNSVADAIAWQNDMGCVKEVHENCMTEFAETVPEDKSVYLSTLETLMKALQDEKTS